MFTKTRNKLAALQKRLVKTMGDDYLWNGDWFVKNKGQKMLAQDLSIEKVMEIVRTK